MLPLITLNSDNTAYGLLAKFKLLTSN